MVVVEVADTGGGELGLRSTVYGFSLNGSSWLLECHSTSDQRQVLMAACRQALASITETGGP